MELEADQIDGYHVYLLRCSDGSFYCGITKDIERRIREHNDGVGAKYTRGRGPVELLAFTPRLSKPDALRFEHSVKSVKKMDKLSCFTLEPLSRIV
jgi:putative endonuclease